MRSQALRRSLTNPASDKALLSAEQDSAQECPGAKYDGTSSQGGSISEIQPGHPAPIQPQGRSFTLNQLKLALAGEQFEALTADNTALRAELDALKAAPTPTPVQSMESLLASIRELEAELEEQAGLAAQLAEAKAQVTALQGQKADLQAQLSALTPPPPPVVAPAPLSLTYTHSLMGAIDETSGQDNRVADVRIEVTNEPGTAVEIETRNGGEGSTWTPYSGSVVISVPALAEVLEVRARCTAPGAEPSDWRLLNIPKDELLG